MFFGYFLNTKKVTPSADSVIGPAKAGGLPLFPHAASVPAPALAPIRSHFACGETGLAGYRPRLLGLPRKIGRGISLRTPWAAVRFAAMASPPRTALLPLGVLGGLGAKREEKIEFVMEFEIQFF